ncbi:hypothetical protein [Kosakonia sacchari]|uniref:Bacteriocin immunity protein n=1 Tax=Kosakonia sacchari TaxID=1158459 RepID=A0ABZ0MRI3_9ENTR|nr:hypothetical protein [Kosakonia sacchari]WOZ77717.1 hypothetical protein Q8Y70_01195 [Kosakonia sacchari]
MNDDFSILNELIMEVAVKIRNADTPGEGEINALYRELDGFCDTYKDEDLVPKK